MRLLSVDPEGRPSAARARDMLAPVAARQVDSHAGPLGMFRTEEAPTEAEGPGPARVDGPLRRWRATALLGLVAGPAVVDELGLVGDVGELANRVRPAGRDQF